MLNFLSVFQQMHNEAFKKLSIINFFKHISLVSFNSKWVFEKIKEKQASQSKTPSKSIDNNSFATSHTTRQIVDNEFLLKAMIKESSDVSQRYQALVAHYLKESIAISYEKDIMKKELQKAKSQAIAKASCKKLKENIAQNGSVISVKNVQVMIIECAEDKVMKVRNTLYYYNIKEAKKAAKTAECITINEKKAVTKVKREAKELIKSERIAYLASLIE